jgi:hypothetical protein
MRLDLARAVCADCADSLGSSMIERDLDHHEKSRGARYPVRKDGRWQLRTLSAAAAPFR